MEEEEIVISSWQQDSFSRMIKRSSKEYIDMNALLSEPNHKTRKSSQESLDDELDNDTLSRLIEGDLKSNEEHDSLNRSRKPKPKPRSPRNDTGSKVPIKNSAEQLFSGLKNSADKSFSAGKDLPDKLFSGRNDSADKSISGAKDSADRLFSGVKVKGKNDDTVTPPRPVPRPRSKPEKASRQNSNQGLNFLNEASESSKFSADKLFDSTGKNSKSVSFVEANKNNVSTSKKVSQKTESIEKKSSNKRAPPKKSPRSKQNSNNSRNRKSSDENDSEQNLERTSEPKQRPKPQQRQHIAQDKKVSESNGLTAGHNSGSHWSSDGMELFGNRRTPDDSDVRHERNFGGDITSSGDTSRRLDDMVSGGRVSENDGNFGRNGGGVSEGGAPRWEPNRHENDGNFRRNSGEAREGGAPRWEPNQHENDGNFRRNGGGAREGGAPRWELNGHENDHGNFRRNGEDAREGGTPRWEPNQHENDGNFRRNDGGAREGGAPKWEPNGHENDGNFRRNGGDAREGGTPKWEPNGHENDGNFRRNGGEAREGGTPRWEPNGHDGSLSRNSGGYSRSKHEKMQEDSPGKSHDRRGNTRDMFEDHVPVSNEIVLDGQENRANQHGRRPSGKETNIRSPMRAHKGLNEMTKSPDMYDYRYESRDSPQNEMFSRSKGTLSNQRSSSLTDLNSWKNTQFDYEEESSGSPRSGFSSSRGIRDAVYAEWLEKKQGKLKEAAKKKVDKKRKEEEKIKEKQEKQILAKKTFEAWSSKKEEVIKTEVKKKKEIKEKELETTREKISKKQDAKKFFESWKSKKDEILKESYKEKKAREKEVKQMKIEDHKEQIGIAKKAYDKWKLLKDEQLKEEAQSARKGEKLKTKYEKEAEMEKRQEREKTYQEFLRKKGTGKRAPPSPTLTQRAWCPGGLTKGSNLIPEKVQPVIAPPVLNRSRSFSGTTRAMMSFNANKRLSRGW